MDVILAGGSIRMLQGLLSATPTLMIGLFVAAIFRYYLRTDGTQRLFGGSSVMSLPQSWAVGMLLPVCSIGVIPILCEMRRQGIRAGSITAFALAAPLFNPLSLLYGLTLSRSSVIIGFALGSLFIVTVLGICWDRLASTKSERTGQDPTMISLRRLAACLLYMIGQLAGKTGLYVLLAVFGLFILGAALPHGALQDQVEQLDPLAPAKMSVLAIFIYATPILTMSQLGMMFDHANSPGAAFVLLLLGTGINFATLWWIQANFGFKSAAIWFTLLFACVLGVAYAVERPLIPPGIEPAGHTHAFDIYTNPYHSGDPIGLALLQKELGKIGPFEWIAGGVVGVLLLAGLVCNSFFSEPIKAFLESDTGTIDPETQEGLHRHVSSRTVGLTCIGGLIALSIVGCYAFYPAPDECLEEMRLARTEVLSGVVSKDYERAKLWIPILEGWSRRLEVGYAIRNFELRPYQKMQAYLLRKKLEDMEHAIEHQAEYANAPESDLDAAMHLQEELEELNTLRQEVSENAKRLNASFR
jgi:uncharacterized membrane protein YraQ (UPF0718 family)